MTEPIQVGADGMTPTLVNFTDDEIGRMHIESLLEQYGLHFWGESLGMFKADMGAYWEEINRRITAQPDLAELERRILEALFRHHVPEPQSWISSPSTVRANISAVFAELKGDAHE